MDIIQKNAVIEYINKKKQDKFVINLEIRKFILILGDLIKK